MPNTKAAAKAWRQTKKRTAHNNVAKAKLETVIKFARKAMTEKSAEATAKVQAAIKLLDRTAQKGVIKQGQASRKKSRLMKALNAVKK